MLFIVCFVLFICATCLHADSSLTPSMRRDYYRGSTDSLAERQRSDDRQSRMRPGRSYSLVRGEAWFWFDFLSTCVYLCRHLCWFDTLYSLFSSKLAICILFYSYLNSIKLTFAIFCADSPSDDGRGTSPNRSNALGRRGSYKTSRGEYNYLFSFVNFLVIQEFSETKRRTFNLCQKRKTKKCVHEELLWVPDEDFTTVLCLMTFH